MDKWTENEDKIALAPQKDAPFFQEIVHLSTFLKTTEDLFGRKFYSRLERTCPNFHEHQSSFAKNIGMANAEVNTKNVASWLKTIARLPIPVSANA